MGLVSFYGNLNNFQDHLLIYFPLFLVILISIKIFIYLCLIKVLFLFTVL